MLAYSLRSFSSWSREAVNLLEILTLHLTLTTVEGTRYGPFENVDFLNSLLGLRRLNSGVVAVQKWLCVLVDTFERCPSREPFLTEQLCSAMASLSNLSTAHEVTRRLVSILVQKLRSSEGPLSPWSFAEAVYGMRKFYECGAEHSRQVDTLLLVLLSKIEDSRNSSKSFSEKEFVRICAQLSSLSVTESQAVQLLVEFLAKKLQLSDQSFSSSGLSILLHGARGLRSNRRSTRNLVVSLTSKVHLLPEPFSVDEFCHAVSGLGRMNSSHESVRTLFLAIAEKCPPDLWREMTLDRAALLVTGMACLNPFEFEAVNFLLAPLSEIPRMRTNKPFLPEATPQTALEALALMASRSCSNESASQSQRLLLKRLESLFR
jgi:hypothetical protein